MNKNPTKYIVAENMPTFAHIDVIDAKKRPKHTAKGYHYHNCYQIIIIENGHIELIVNNIIKRVNTNTLIMIGNNLPHGTVCYSSDIKVTILHIPYTSLSWCNNIPEDRKSVV